MSCDVQDGGSDPRGVAQITSQCEVVWGAAEANHFTLNTCVMYVSLYINLYEYIYIYIYVYIYIFIN